MIDHVYESMIDNKIFELLHPENFILGLRQIGIQLDEKEILCLMEILAKQELENEIIMDELEEIFMNVQNVIDNGEDISQS